tara:strand:+ start:144 stop:524 length:381 start_codon:yes stop_codon:yes gene_type:complete
MSTIKTVLKHINNEELSVQKVDLGLVDNLRSYAKGISKYKGEGEGLLKKANRIKQELSEIQKALFKWSEVGDSIADDIIRDLKMFEKEAKELGFNAEIQIDYSNASDVFKEYAKLAQKYEKEAKSI